MPSKCWCFSGGEHVPSESGQVSPGVGPEPQAGTGCRRKAPWACIPEGSRWEVGRYGASEQQGGSYSHGGWEEHQREPDQRELALSFPAAKAEKETYSIAYCPRVGQFITRFSWSWTSLVIQQ